jgi:ATP-dependent DNA helicase RecQ
VVSPLIALMRDQVDSLTKKGVSAACISSANKDSENNRILQAVIGRKLNTTKMKSNEVGQNPISILYVTPESLQTQKFQSILNELSQTNRLAFFAIDECHCLSTWGHDFRPGTSAEIRPPSCVSYISYRSFPFSLSLQKA